MAVIPEQRQWLHFYIDQVTNNFLPFWEKAVDSVHGGLFTCFNNEGTELVSRRKYVWSQGRSVWLWARVARLGAKAVLPVNAQIYLDRAAKTAAFLKAHALLEGDVCAYVLDEDGAVIEDEHGTGPSSSIFADCFVVLGFTEYAAAAADAGTLDIALRIFDSIERRLAAGTYQTEPYPIPEGFEAQSIPMMMVNITHELAEAAAAFGHTRAALLRERATAWRDIVMRRHRAIDNTLIEMIPSNGANADTMLAQHIYPGHTLECMWFVIHEAQASGKMEDVRDALLLMERAYALGWDREHGGFLRYVDRNGVSPKGRLIGNRMETLILNTWDKKIWWVHAEALYASLLAYVCSGANEWLERYKMTAAYVFRTFPHPDPAVGEWIQIRDRRGLPVDQQVALPVKDPFHILRIFLLIIELLDNHRGSGAG